MSPMIEATDTVDEARYNCQLLMMAAEGLSADTRGPINQGAANILLLLDKASETLTALCTEAREAKEAKRAA